MNTIEGYLVSEIDASTKNKGVIRIATLEEAIQGILNNTAITPFTLKNVNNNKFADFEIDLNEETYVLTITFKNENGDVLEIKSIDFPIENTIVNCYYDNENKQLVFVLKSGTEIEVPVGDLIEGLQAEITVGNKLSSDLVDDTNKNNKFVTVAEKELLDSISVTASEINSLDDIDGNVQDQIDALDSVVSDNYNTLDDKIDSINGALSDSITALDNKYSSITGGLSDDIDALESVVSANYNTLDDKIDSINGALSDSIDSLSSVVSDNYNTLDSLIGGVDDKIDTHIADKANPHEVTATQVGLGNVDNTSDADKPVSTAQQTALDGKVDKLVSKPTAGAYTKVTITSEGLVSNGDTLIATDIPSLTLTKISDVTASASEVNILDGAILSTTELNYVDGVTSSIQTQLNNKLEKKPDGTNDLIDNNNKINLLYVPDVLLGQVIYAGVFNGATAVATLTTNAKTKLGTTSNTITLTNDTTAITGYGANEGCFYICEDSGTFASTSFQTGDWLLSTGTAWKKIDNTDAVTGVKGNAESSYRIGNINITGDNVLPDQTNNNGKAIRTNGTTVSWGDVITSIATGITNGTILVSLNGGTPTAISVYGLGSAAFTPSTDYATSIQGGLADSAIQSVKVNGTALTPDVNKTVDVTVPTNYVTTDTNQDIIGTKTYIGQKKIEFKQSGADDKLGFTCFDVSSNEIGAFEYRPNTINGGALLNVNVSYASTSYVGFRYWGTNVNIVAPKVATAGSYYIPVNVTNGNTTVTATNTGTVDISSLMPSLSGYQTTANLVTSVSSSSTDSQYPSAKLFYDTCGDIETLINAL